MPANDEWFEAEPPTRVGMVTELQRIKLRTKVRPLPVLAIALFLTGAIVYKQMKKHPLVEAQIVLVLEEAGGHQRTAALPVDALRDYILTVLLPDSKLLDYADRKHIDVRMRKLQGDQFVVDDIRESLEVFIWKNSFVNYSEDESNSARSARIGLSVASADADEAYERVRDLADIIIQTADEKQQLIADQITKQIDTVRESIARRVRDRQRQIAVKQGMLTQAKLEANEGQIAVYTVELQALTDDAQRDTDKLKNIAVSPEVMASRRAAAGMGLSLSIVSERRPEQPVRSWFALAIVAAVVGVGAFIGVALVIGAFDGRVHDVDDVTRLGLPVLGHLPGFTGDRVGSLQARGAARRRVPLFRRWRSHR